MSVLLHCACSQSHTTLCNPMDCGPPGFLCTWNFASRNTGVSCHFLFRGILQTQGQSTGLLCLLHCQVNSLPLSHLGSPPCYSILVKRRNPTDNLSQKNISQKLQSSLFLLKYTKLIEKYQIQGTQCLLLSFPQQCNLVVQIAHWFPGLLRVCIQMIICHKFLSQVFLYIYY